MLLLNPCLKLALLLKSCHVRIVIVCIMPRDPSECVWDVVEVFWSEICGKMG